MAAGTKLILRFGTTSGEKNFTYNYASSSPTATDVKAAMQAMIDNGSIFRYPPLTMISARVEMTSVSDIDLS